MKKSINFLLIWLFYISQQAHSQGLDELSSGTRDLLRSEMFAISKGMNELFSAYYSGDFEEVSRIAKNIENTFILKNKITKEQRHEIHTKLPKAFLQKDKTFHYNAGMLAHAAKNGKAELVGFYYSELANGCIGCHSVYANKRFRHLDRTNNTFEEHDH